MKQTTLYMLVALCAASGAAALAATRNRGGDREGAWPRARAPFALPTMPSAEHEHIKAARGFSHSSALLAFSALADSAVEHYRGSFDNNAMYAPLAAATGALLAGLHGGVDRTEASHSVRHAVYLAAVTTGVAGTAFHLYNVTKRPGGWSWHNLFYGAPLGAPLTLLLSGALGAVGERLRNEPAEDPQLFGMPAGRALALATSIGLAGTVAEVALLHFRGAFQHRAMYVPVTVPPVAAVLLTHAALSAPQSRWFTRVWLRMTATLGLVGSLFHARGVARSQGGWRNWSQNVLAGPPLPAPPGFTALAMAGLAALRMRETEK
ncbi:hypothetical protein [Paraburkholderia sp. HD33-4]|uniref:hypothetical protein n=1 Tax=Paraburkholderia sp. HD33-4 TaxID=2883242 RepID=UPI001F20C7B4|nr:hypothetical protein [Paraburkholderia sp. HD33-4]